MCSGRLCLRSRRRSFTDGRPAGIRDDVRDQARLVRRVLVEADDGLPDSRHSANRGLDLSQLDAEAAELDLAIRPAEVLEVPGGQKARPVAGAVETPASPEGIGNEPLLGQLRSLAVTPRDSGSAHVEIADDADGDRTQLAVEHVRLDVRQRTADRHGAGRLRRILPRRLPERRRHGRLRRPVRVDQRDAAAGEIPPLREAFGQGLFAADDHQPQRLGQGEPLGGRDRDELVPIRRRQIENGNVAPAAVAHFCGQWCFRRLELPGCRQPHVPAIRADGSIYCATCHPPYQQLTMA